VCATPRLIVSMLSGLVELLARWRVLEAEVSKAIYLTFIAFLAGLASLFEVGLTAHYSLFSQEDRYSLVQQAADLTFSL
jgi:hypothetical protein